MTVKRQGDVLLIKVSAEPGGTSEITPSARGFVLAEGEATGHAHVIEDTELVTVRSLAEELFINVVESVQVVHEEHDAVMLETGVWRVVRQVEYTPELPRWVLD